MNERIQEFAWKADRYANSAVDKGMEFHEAYTEKFAELIIRECAKWIEETDPDEYVGYEDAKLLLQHFGVKE